MAPARPAVRLPRLFAAVSALLAVAFAVPAALATDASGCTVIDDLPAVIERPGLYCLMSDHEVELSGGAAIEIQADHVTIDLQGHTIDNTRAGHASIASGISSWERGHIVVRDGILIGFEEAVALSGPFGGNLSTGHLVEGMRIVDSGETGIGITGNDSIVRGNSVHRTGAGLSSKDPTSGIALGGWRNRAIDNDVTYVAGHPASNVAIRFIHGGNHMAIGNRISSADTAISFPVGQLGFYRDNLVSGAPCCNVFEGGTDLGGNAWQ